MNKQKYKIEEKKKQEKKKTKIAKNKGIPSSTHSNISYMHASSTSIFETTAIQNKIQTNIGHGDQTSTPFPHSALNNYLV